MTEMVNKDTGEIIAYPISEILRRHRGGELNALLTAALEEVARAVYEEGGKGNLTLKIEIAGKQGESYMTFTPSHTIKKPTTQSGPTFVFTQPDGRVLHEDPAQREMDLRDVSRPQAPLKDLQDTDIIEA